MSENDKKSKPLVQRNEKGQLLPGNTPNPGGRPKGLEKMLRDRFAADWPAMADVMRDLALGRVPKNTSLGVINIKPRDMIEAYKTLHDRAWGKAKVVIDLAADIGAGGLSGVAVDDLDDHALQQLRDTIASALDPHRRVIDAKSAYKDTPKIAPAVEPEVAAAQAVIIASEDGSAPFTDEQIERDEALTPEQVAAFAAPPRELVRHVFKGSANVATAVLDVGSGIVEVTFTSGARYRFANFTRELLAQWGLAVSAGKWFNLTIKQRPLVHPPVRIE